MPQQRARLNNVEMRKVALDAACGILTDDGPQAVTLTAVAARINRTHANVLHHFGSAEGLRRAMAETMATRVVSTIAAEVLRMRETEDDARAVVDLVFDIFEREGLSALMSWMTLSRDHAALSPILESLHDLVEQLGDHRGASVRRITQALVMGALADGLLGAPIASALELPRDAMRETMAMQIQHMRGW
ncbi:TetR/AcrR family transcriptional regulator [Sphingomonas montanisoli]|uniref:Helix-turn-helix transcriptional regulator n=1 Tax=Sphingomonas montanisoli TaxID=2606412 RepID=A0A5D9CGV2_9SPHN|nr:TetR family transcriptional regulator [Sphingomonas montanisoli]TZG29341.1 helix-turn-helix transcriptional regulator [Sphingomonas montanisoli]